MYNIFASVIEKGGFRLDDMLHRLRTFSAEGRLTLQELHDLETMARNKANFNGETDVFAKLNELEERVRALETAQGQTDTPAEEYPDFIPGNWYRAGDKVTFGGKRYTCAAPDGVVCVWSPEDYPAYWTPAE